MVIEKFEGITDDDIRAALRRARALVEEELDRDITKG